MQFSSRWTQTTKNTLNAVAQYNRTIGLFNFLNQIPEYAPEMYTLYRYCRITGVDVTLEVSAQTTSGANAFGIEAAMARIPFDQSAGITPQALRLVRDSRYSLISQIGMNRCVLRAHYGSFDELGNPVYDRIYWQSLADASVTTPTDVSTPVVACSVRSVVGDNAIVSCNLTVCYHLQFFELELSPIPALIEEPEDESDEALVVRSLHKTQQGDADGGNKPTAKKMRR